MDHFYRLYLLFTLQCYQNVFVPCLISPNFAYLSHLVVSEPQSKPNLKQEIQVFKVRTLFIVEWMVSSTTIYQPCGRVKHLFPPSAETAARLNISLPLQIQVFKHERAIWNSAGFGWTRPLSSLHLVSLEPLRHALTSHFGCTNHHRLKAGRSHLTILQLPQLPRQGNISTASSTSGFMSDWHCLIMNGE